MIDKPNYTQIPNIILDDFIMCMGDAEFKVVMAISRQTFGYHRARHKMSLATLKELTGLSKQGVINGVNAGIERGVIDREPDGDSYEYGIVINDSASQRNGLADVNEMDTLAGQRNGLADVNEMDRGSQRSGQEGVNEVDRLTPVLKKELKKELNKEERKGEAAQAPAPPPKVVSDGVKGTATVRIDSDYLKNCEFVNGYILPGTGQNAVQVYYERFEIRNNDWRLRKPHEDDLVLNCKDLDLLREVITAYDQENFVKPRNVKLILDWYRHPERFRKEHHANHGTNNPSDCQRPSAAQFTQAEWREYAEQKRAELPF